MLIGFSLFTHCKQDRKDEKFTLRIRLADEPDCLHPVVSQSSIATQIEALIMPPLFEYSPGSLELSSILITKLSDPIQVNDSTLSYTYQLQPKAVWDDGTSLSSDDVLYTIKSSLNPCLKNKTYIGFFKNIRDVICSSTDLKSVTFLVNSKYMLNREMSGNYYIYPEYVYDPKKIMRKFSLNDLLKKDSAAWKIEEWNELKAYANEYQSIDYCREKISGCGAYKLISWQAGSKIILEKKKNWWGDSLVKDFPLLASYPERIEYLIMPDEASALLELKKGSIDLVSDVTPEAFKELEQNNNDKLSFATPTLLQYLYIEINHRNIILQSRNVREAIAHLIDLDAFIKDQYNGLAIKVNSPVHPSVVYYNNSMTQYDFNTVYAADLLKKDGWKDTNNDGVLDKFINGKLYDLEFKFKISNKESSKKLGLLLQEEAKKIGIKINLEPKEAASFMTDLNALNFDLALLVQRRDPKLWDPFQSWSSTNTKPGGFNKSGYATSTSDSLILAIREASDTRIRNDLYLKFQQLLHDDVAQIFLLSPKERIAYSKRIKVLESSRRPGYFEGMINIK